MSVCNCIHCRYLRALRANVPGVDWDGIILKNINPSLGIAENKKAVSPVLHEHLLEKIDRRLEKRGVNDFELWNMADIAVWWEWHDIPELRSGPEPVLPGEETPTVGEA